MSTSFYDVNQILQTKQPINLPEEVWYDAIPIISLPLTQLGTNPKPYGSYQNRFADYFGDIDLRQLYVHEGKLELFAPQLTKQFQKIVSNILKSDNFFYSEIKAGLDKRYKFDIGNLENNKYILSQEMNTIPKDLFDNGLLEKNEMKAIDHILRKGNLDGNDYDIISNLFRDHYVLRWTSNDIIKGYHKVKGMTYYLQDVILDKTPLKIDMIMVTVEDRFLEVTNFIDLGLKVPEEIQDQTIEGLNKETGEINGYYLPINFKYEDYGETIPSLQM